MDDSLGMIGVASRNAVRHFHSSHGRATHYLWAASWRTRDAAAERSENDAARRMRVHEGLTMPHAATSHFIKKSMDAARSLRVRIDTLIAVSDRMAAKQGGQVDS